jgi:F-type H+-transporting ATPase subunit delta
MKLSKEAQKLSKGLLRISFSDGALDADKVKKATAAIIKSKPRNYVGVLKEYARLIRMEVAKSHAVIESATEMEASEKSAITRTLRSKYGSEVTTDYSVNPDLIGGLRIQVGSNVVDTSVRSRLDRLATELAS